MISSILKSAIKGADLKRKYRDAIIDNQCGSVYKSNFS
jgi:hypothetical protein